MRNGPCYDTDQFLCWIHGRFIPCRKSGEHFLVNDIVMLALGHAYHRDHSKPAQTWPEFLEEHGWPDPTLRLDTSDG